MTSSPAFLHLISTIAASLVAAIGEAVVLTVVTALCLAVCPAASAAARSRIWMIVFGSSTLLPMFHALQPVSIVSAYGTSSIRVGAVWAWGLLSFWAVLFVYRGAHLVRSALHLRHVAKRATPIATDDELFGLLTAKLDSSSRCAVELCSSNDIDVPSVIGFLRPRILLPVTLLKEMSPLDLRQIVLHEMEHLRRRDDWTNLLQKTILVLCPMNPVLFWIERRLCLERELACDDGVVRATGAGRAYATCLANLAEHSLLRRGMTLALGAWHRHSELTRRVLRILRAPQPEMDCRSHRFPVVAAMVFVIGGAVTLARMPQFVTFGADAAMPAVAGLSSTADIPRTIPTMPVPNLTLVSAVLRGPTRPFAMKAKRSSSRRSVPGHMRIHHDVSRPWMVLTEWRDARYTPRLAFAVSQNSQIKYAAIPVRDGWLVVQL